MDPLSFTAQLVGSLAWPLTILIVALAFRGPILNLVGLITHLRYGGVEVAFGQTLTAIDGNLNAMPPPRSAPDFEADAIRAVAERFPTAAVMDAWRALEADLDDISDDELGPMVVSVVANLRELRNEVAHTTVQRPIAVEQALTYVDLAKRTHQHLLDVRSRRRALRSA